jgi:hypothetical protein
LGIGLRLLAFSSAIEENVRSRVAGTGCGFETSGITTAPPSVVWSQVRAASARADLASEQLLSRQAGRVAGSARRDGDDDVRSTP